MNLDTSELDLMTQASAAMIQAKANPITLWSLWKNAVKLAWLSMRKKLHTYTSKSMPDFFYRGDHVILSYRQEDKSWHLSIKAMSFTFENVPQILEAFQVPQCARNTAMTNNGQIHFIWDDTAR